MTQMIPRSQSRKVNRYAKVVLPLEAVRRKREARYDLFMRLVDGKRAARAADPAARAN